MQMAIYEMVCRSFVPAVSRSAFLSHASRARELQPAASREHQHARYTDASKTQIAHTLHENARAYMLFDHKSTPCTRAIDARCVVHTCGVTAPSAAADFAAV